VTPQVVVIENEKFDAGVAREVLGDVADVTVASAGTRTELVAAARGADALIPWYVPIDEGILAELDSLRVLGYAGTGVDSVDLDAAAARGVTVVTAGDYAADEVSTHALALLLSCVRALPTYDATVRGGGWDRAAGAPIHRLRGRTLGLVAFGSIARRTAGKAAAFGLDVIAYDPYVDAAALAERGVTRVGFDELFARADLVSAHAPLTPETEGLIDRDALAALDGGILVNTGRGPVVDEAGLLAALKADDVAAAGLDVYETEPPAGSPLLDREDVVLSPHVGWYSEESRDDCIRNVARDVRRVLAGEPPRSPAEPGEGW